MLRRSAVVLLLVAGCASAPQAPAGAEAALAARERAWLDAYDTGDREAMADFLADGFTITFPNGRVDTRADVIGGLRETPRPEGAPTHDTEDRTIRVLGRTAILTGVYVSPGPEGRPHRRQRYTDTWMWLDGAWRVVASHLSRYGE